MKDIHPLKRKSIRPSSSTVRGMLPARQFRALDAALQSLRATGLRFDWRWVDKDIGWICEGVYEDRTFCELLPAEDPLIGRVTLSHDEIAKGKAHKKVPAKYKLLLDHPLTSGKKSNTYEIELVTTEARDYFSDFVELLNVFIETKN